MFHSYLLNESTLNKNISFNHLVIIDNDATLYEDAIFLSLLIEENVINNAEC